ncbi:hypothetical protein F5141DRAFT_1197139 [Pisolithus sp. B1]|nr:hypothetical protein F5141DRAFT_1197139 [Pisolithus sp. B1]
MWTEGPRHPVIIGRVQDEQVGSRPIDFPWSWLGVSVGGCVIYYFKLVTGCRLRSAQNS